MKRLKLYLTYGLIVLLPLILNGNFAERSQNITHLKNETFDLLVVGAGATGSGIALDAASRGYHVALIEAEDFASGTSGKSTKLAHGGVRYLERAFTKFDFKQFWVVKDSLHERKILLDNAPQLTRRIPIIIPLYHWYEVPYYWIGIKLYEKLSREQSLGNGEYLSAYAVAEKFPGINSKKLYGGILFYDGQFDDVRMNLSIALTAKRYGAVVTNYTQFIDLLKEGSKIVGGTVKDALTGEKFPIRAKVIVNATGPFADHIRYMDSKRESLVAGSTGTHIVIDGALTHSDHGLIIPKTSNGSVLFLLPWKGSTLIGTTDNPTSITNQPKPTEEDIRYILKNVHDNLGLNIHRSEVKAAWTGIRPLVKQPGTQSTTELSRSFFIENTSPSLYTITGGKWTTYRKMAQEAVDKIIASGDLEIRDQCQTKAITLVDEGRNIEIKKLAQNGFSAPLVKGYPYTQAEVIYAVRKEMAQHAIDILARRTHLALLNQQATIDIIPLVVSLMAQEFGWNSKQQKDEIAYTKRALQQEPEGLF